MVKPASFPYKNYKGNAYPIIDIEIQNIQNKIWIPIEAYADSGASFSIFGIKDALRIGIDYKSGKRIFSVVGNGERIPVYLHRLNIKLGTISFSEMVGFSSELKIGFNLLGQNIFDHFIVTFNNSAKIISFQPLNQ